MVVIPLAYDQPAMASRLTWLHVAEALPVMRLSARRIQHAITKVLADASYEDGAKRLQAQIATLHGAERAAAIIESALRKRPCTRAKEGPVIDCSVVAQPD